MDEQGEKRRSSRSAYGRSVEYELSSLGAEELMPVKREGVGVNISENGMSIFTDYPLKKGEVVKIFFPLSSMRMRLPIFARVAWAKTVEERFLVGMQFLH
jgi:hypothetical protein